MDPLLIGLVVLLLLFFFLGAGVWIFSALIAVASLSLIFILDFPVMRVGSIATKVILTSAMKWELVAIPLFIFVGEIIFRSDISARIFSGLRPVLGRVPGGLLHSNVLGCTLFAAVSGSSSATTATVGRITLPTLQEQGFDRSLAIGSLAASGSLGLLIPPSIMLIIYGVLAEQSIVKLFAAGILPGLLISLLFSSYIAFRYLRDPPVAPPVRIGSSLKETFSHLLDLVPILFLMVLVLGGIYSGLATPSEAAAVGVAGAVLVVAFLGQLKWNLLVKSAKNATLTSCMICSILIAASFLSSAMGYLHLPQNVAEAIGALGTNPILLITLLALFYIVLGFFLDGISIAVMTLPITLPIVVQAGFDPIWYGIFLVIMVETGLVTPPLGFNLFVLQGLTGERMGDIAKAALPFFLLMLLAVAILVVFPQIVLWLPEYLDSLRP
ncbi:TRAP transporter large permease subunit [Ruegeria sp. R14_0]|uniref:TRAP transporter large permease n=1 Tax=Ruegeria sp. R14_0 TaxID=2821100 RepID=UPI001ADCA516|nr:TRAP transporter large permease subunit [Ruegeria sp. R14_0]MBO9448456.1 TRAP transporter large permease subunit [Ruegeria sp. R14_0]